MSKSVIDFVMLYKQVDQCLASILECTNHSNSIGSFTHLENFFFKKEVPYKR